MNTPNTNASTTPQTAHVERRNAIAAGVVLILAGAGMLFFRQMDIFILMLVLGIGMTVLGILTRTSGWMIPGGIVAGIGLGIAALETPLVEGAAMDGGGIFLLCFGAGFASITLFSKLFGEETHTWALIPGGIMAFIGGLVLLENPGLKVLELVGRYFWPAGLILAGVYILLKLARRPQQ